MLEYSKICQIEDFKNPEINKIISDVFGHEFDQKLEDDAYVGDSKRWEIAMAIRTLADHDILNRSSDILGVGAGLETTSYYLTKRTGRVFATDIYANAGDWSYGAPLGMLLDTSKYYKSNYEENRLLPMHMDARRMRFPDESFDGIYSSGSIEHLGSLEYVANCSHEMGRVLKKGGVLTVATEYKISGPHDGIGWDPFVILFSPKLLNKYIVEASGLKMIGEPNYEMSDDTAKLSQPLLEFLNKVDRVETKIRRSEAYPNLVLSHEGYVFGSVHLGLYKPKDYVGGSNMWAEPKQDLLKTIQEDNNSSIEKLTIGKIPDSPVEISATDPSQPATPKEYSETSNSILRLTNYISRLIGKTYSFNLPLAAEDNIVFFEQNCQDLKYNDCIFKLKMKGGRPASGEFTVDLISNTSAQAFNRKVSLKNTLMGQSIRMRAPFIVNNDGVTIKMRAIDNVTCEISYVKIRSTNIIDRIRSRLRRMIKP